MENHMAGSVGVLGGGQLGLMLVEAANPLGIRVNILDAASAPAKQVSNHDGHVAGSFKDPEAIKKLALRSSVVTAEIEHVDTEALEEISRQTDVQPSWKTIRVIQDKFLQKGHLHDHGVATADSIALEEPTSQELEKVSEQLGLPFMLKSRREAYDGRGNFPVKSKGDFDAALHALGSNSLLYAERWANFKMELAVMVVKTANDVLSYPTVEVINENSICKLTYAPARGVSSKINEEAQALARKAVASFWGKGIFGVEMFLMPDDRLLINEIAPRPHNTGHYTIEGCHVSQFEAHLRAILDKPLRQKDLSLRQPSIMLNILGSEAPNSHLLAANEAEKDPSMRIHLYGKGDARKGRKMGHVTVCAPTMAEAEASIQPLVSFIDAGFRTPPPTSIEAGSRTTPPLAATDAKSTIPIPVSSAAPRPSSSETTQSSKVAVIMGSDSDLPVLMRGLSILEKLRIPYSTRITSAHRTPEHMFRFAAEAEGRGFEVIIAAAGGAAHLPGMTASHTDLPVIGLPIKGSTTDGMDAVLSILNMPAGIPVATVSLNNSSNAAILAARILARKDGGVRERLREYRGEMEREVLVKDERMERVGAGEYFEGMGRK